MVEFNWTSYCSEVMTLVQYFQAEDWLREQAKALGWNAAMKVQSRRATQGLIGVAINNKKVAMVELNCETDFVSRNEKFKEMVDLVTSVCLKYPVLNPGEDTKEVCKL